jgi:4-alpha-glucanotransferase
MHVALQWLFHGQWQRLRTEATARGIALWGDQPIFVGGESCDVWANRELFRLDASGLPTVVTGVPPDAFTEDGQLWGTPHYANEVHHQTGFAWWCQRMGTAFECFDAVRLDHFRGVESVWEIPAGASAKEGRWVPGLGAPLLRALSQHLDGLPLIAEDLGIITPEVRQLRDAFELPGMAILQFAFGDPNRGDHEYLPHQHRRHVVVYPGTHDNDTAAGWYQSADEATRHHVRRYLSVDGRDMAWDLIRCAYHSVGNVAIVAMQDILSLGTHARMNVPGVADGNWAWRVAPTSLHLDLARQVAEEVHLSGRSRVE